MTTGFDEFRDTYREEVEKSTSFIGRDLSFFTEAKADILADLARQELGDPSTLHVLDVGCGPGETDSFLVDRFGAVDGVDVAEQVVAAAARRNPAATYTSYDGEHLPYAEGAFDLVFAINVVHHVLPERWEPFVSELARVVRVGGILALIEHNPFNPLTRLAVARCVFDDDAVLLRRGRAQALLDSAALERRHSRYVTFFPWRSRALARVERRLRRVPLGAQYVVAGRRRGR